MVNAGKMDAGWIMEIGSRAGGSRLY